MKYIDKLKQLNACEDAVDWCANYPSLEEAWQACHRGDWMLWLIARVNPGEPGSRKRRKIARAAADCAELVLPIYEERYPDNDSPRKAIEAAKRGDPDECRAAVAAAFAAAADADASAAAYADADADASAAAYAAADAAAYADAYADAFAAAAFAADAAAADARENTHKRCADIVRKNYPNPPRWKANEGGSDE